MNSNLSKWFQLLAKVDSDIDSLYLAECAYQNNNIPVYPAREKVFAALELMAPEDVKVVILGQDPYHTPGQAQGLAFSLLDGGKSQPSVRNILKELENDLGEARASQDFTSYSSGYVRAIHGLFQKSLDLAIKLGLIQKNIAKQVGNVKKTRQKVDFWTKEEAEKVFSTKLKIYEQLT